MLGSLCVIDDKPRAAGLTERQANTLVALARQVMIQLELRQALQQNAVQTKLLEAAQRDILAERTSERDRLWRISQDILISLDTSGMFVSVSPVVTEILGWTPEEMIGRMWWSSSFPTTCRSANSALKHAAKNILPTTENRYRHKDGGFRWMSWLAAPEGDLIFATGRHITAEKEAAERSQPPRKRCGKPEDGSGRPADRRHRARLQQSPGGHQRQPRTVQTRIAQGRFDEVDASSTRRRVRPTRRGADPSPAGLLAAPDRSIPSRPTSTADRRHGGSDPPHGRPA